jgi:hypothetical protein
MAGTINLSLTQQLDEYGKPLSGGQLWIIQAGTVSTPQNAYQDSALSIPLPNPITLDAAGRIPQFFLADGQIKVRLQDKFGVVKFTQDNLLVIGPSAGGGGGGGSVDPTTVLQTGDIKIRYDTAILSGFVRCNGKTIGNASSGATELADASAQALFNFLWITDTALAVTPGGRGASANADWTANKQLALPDGRSRILAMLGDMGNADAGFWTGVTFTKGNSTTLGALGGRAATPNCNVTLGIANLPPMTPSGVITNGAISITQNAANFAGANNNNGGGGGAFGVTTAPATISASQAASTFTGNPIGGSSTAFGVCPPIMLITAYMKL